MARMHDDEVSSTGREDGPRLLEPTPGVFVLECEYEERFVPKNAGLRWHPGDRCRSPRCPACERGLGKVWWTTDLAAAVKLLEHASEEVAASLEQRAGPAVAKARLAADEKQKSERVQKFQRAVSLRASHAADSKLDIPAPEGLVYLPYQRAGVAYALGRPSTLIADEMGLGKTVEAIAVVNADTSVRSVLVVCPASLKLNWQRECERWLVRDLEVGVAAKAFPDDADVVIVNYDLLGKWEKKLRREWDVLIVDECHYVKNKEAQRSKRLYALQAARKLFLTGTPILNRPVELFPIVSHLAPEVFPKFWGFAQRYCAPIQTNFGWDVTGASNLVELHEVLRGTIMVRRTKADVLKDLPPKRRQVIELASEAVSKLIAAERDAWERHRARLGELRSSARGSEDESGPLDGGGDPEARAALRREVAEAFGELSKLRHATALAKVPLVLEHLEAALQESPKIVVFAHHRDVVERLAEPFADRAVTLTGNDTAERRQASVDRFQTDPTCALFIGSITAAGFGLTLTAASHVVFAELDWVPANMTQAEDRTHRIGQKDSVLVQHLVLEDSLDASMVRTLLKKQEVIDAAVDGTARSDARRDNLFEGPYAEALLAEAAAQRAEASEDLPPTTSGRAPARRARRSGGRPS
jgi:SWI/SNF-related matrix-associated actin-dependent regulator 1 of chromatin subfamily A